MARFFLLCLVAADLITVLAIARSIPELRREISELQKMTAAHPPFSYIHLDVSNSVNGVAPSQVNHKRHLSSHKSIIGGEVILGGFAAAAVLAVVCYIRITRHTSSEEEEEEDEIKA